MAASGILVTGLLMALMAFPSAAVILDDVESETLMPKWLP